MIIYFHNSSFVVIRFLLYFLLARLNIVRLAFVHIHFVFVFAFSAASIEGLLLPSSSFASNVNWQLATFMYSVFENLYLRVEMNFGFISRAKDFTQSTHSFRSASVQPVNFTIDSVHPVVFLSQDDDRIMDAAAIYDGRKRSRLASSMATSWMYWA